MNHHKLDFRTYCPRTFQIPEDVVESIEKWQGTLEKSNGVGWYSRYSFVFSTNGLGDYIDVIDHKSGKKFSWATPIEDW